METRPYHKPGKYEYFHHEYEEDGECEEECECEQEEEEEVTECNKTCPTDPDLLLLRQNAKCEREAVALYLNASTKANGPLCQLFLDIARDEMLHFRQLMILLAKYDSIQAHAFKEMGISLPVSEFRKTQPATNDCYQDRLEIINILTRAIARELDAINMYQESYEKACHDDVKARFCHNANDEKLHVAELWKALMIFTKESNRPS